VYGECPTDEYVQGTKTNVRLSVMVIFTSGWRRIYNQEPGGYILKQAEKAPKRTSRACLRN
jgi:hypothetical protein